MTQQLPAICGGVPALDVPVPFVRPSLPSWEALAPGWESMVRTGMLTKGPLLREFEQHVARHLRVQHAIGVSSCTTGLMLTYQALQLRGEVIVPSFTFMATVGAMLWCGLTPVFAEVERDTTNLDPAAIEPLITPRTTAIVAVHNFGNPANIRALEEIARRHGLRLIFDAAHGFGTLYEGAPVGGAGDAHVFSMSPTKLLVAGEGGIVATNDDELAHRIRLGREYGNTGNYDSAFAGMNARLSELHALLGLKGLERLESTAQARNSQAQAYRRALEGLPGIEFQKVRPQDRSSYKDFSIVIDEAAFGLSRDEVAASLAAEGVDTRKYYDPPVHEQTAYRRFARAGAKLPRTDALARGSLSLPIGAQMDDPTIDRIGWALRRLHECAEMVRARLARTEAYPAGAT